MSKRRLIIIAAALLLMTLLAYALLLNPVFQEKLGWYLSQWAGRLRMWFDPPQQVSFSGDGTLEASADESQPEFLTPEPESGLPAGTPAPTYAPIPQAFNIEGGRYFSQHNRWNYCGPSNLAMLLSYWGWEGTHDEVARAVRTYSKDKNIMPYELKAFAEENANINVLVRVGGSLELLKQFIAAGFPVMVEKGPQFRDIHYHITWMGHYQVMSGYDDVQGHFIAQDSYIEANYKQAYEPFLDEWRSFNYLYMVAYPDHLENDVLNLLGSDLDEEQNYRNTLKKAQEEIYQLEGDDQFFAMFNYGSNLAKLRDYEGAARAYDQAFVMYDNLPKESTVPYRILWYQTGPFMAYYYTGRYMDVITMATRNSIEMVRDDEPALEESYYWRGMSKVAIGDREGGVKDFNTCLYYHRNFPPCVEALNKLGIYP